MSRYLRRRVKLRPNVQSTGPGGYFAAIEVGSRVCLSARIHLRLLTAATEYRFTQIPVLSKLVNEHWSILKSQCSNPCPMSHRTNWSLPPGHWSFLIVP